MVPRTLLPSQAKPLPHSCAFYTMPLRQELPFALQRSVCRHTGSSELSSRDKDLFFSDTNPLLIIRVTKNVLVGNASAFMLLAA